MAKTGRQFERIGLAQAQPFPLVIREEKEGQSNVAIRGAAVLWASGFIDQCGSGPTAVWGFAAEDAANAATAGGSSMHIFKALPGIEFSGSLNVTSLDDTHRGIVVALVNTASTWVLATTSATSDGQAMITGWDSTWEEADSYPVVNFVMIEEKIQYTAS